MEKARWQYVSSRQQVARKRYIGLQNRDKSGEATADINILYIIYTVSGKNGPPKHVQITL